MSAHESRPEGTDGTKRRRPRRKPRKEEILEAARVVVERDGLEAATALRVATEVPISEPSIFYHFGSMKGLLLQLAMQLATREFASLREVVEQSPTGVEALQAVLRARVDRYNGREHLLELVNFWGFSRLSREQFDAVAPLVNAILDVVETKIEQDLQRTGHAPIDDLRPRIAAAWIAGEGVLLTQLRMSKGELQLKHSLDDIVTALGKTFAESLGGRP